MDISKIIFITGQPGLYKVIAQSKNGVIVESLQDKKRFPAFSTSRISTLQDISVYTTGDDMPLKDVYQKIFDKEEGGKAIDPKSTDEAGMRKYMETVLPEYDKDRVHVSDLRKLFNWYNLLQEAGLLTAEETKEEEGDAKALLADKDKPKAPAVKKDVGQKQNIKSNAPKVKAQGVRKSGTA